MRTSILIILIFLSVQIKAQPSHAKDAYIDFIKNFYYHLLDDDTVTVKETTALFNIDALEWESYLFNMVCDSNPKQAVCKERGIYGHEWGDFASIFFGELKVKKNLFTQGYDRNIDSIIDCCAGIYDEEGSGTIAIDIYFPSGKAVYFLMNRYPDEPIYFGDIYFEDGSSIYNYLLGKEESGSKKYLQRLAIINDPDGYTNVREGKGAKYPIVGKIIADEVFMFTPNYYDDWWKVRNYDRSIEGYMHKSRIVPFGILSEERKKELMNRY